MSSGSDEESNTSGSSGSSSPIPSTFPFNRNNLGRIPGQPSGGDGGQHYFKIFDSSWSQGEAAYASTLEVSFCCRGLVSNLRMADLDRIRGRYEFPDGFSLAVPTEDAHVHKHGFVTLYEDALIVSLRLPLHPLSWDLLIFFGITLDQLTPNG